MSTMYRLDSDSDPTVEHADAAFEFDQDDWDGLRRLFCAMANLPLRYEVWRPFAGRSDGEFCSVVRLIEEHTSGDFYLAFVSDCLDPPLYLVRGESWQDAYDEFLVDPKIEGDLKVDPAYASDYGDPDNWHVNDNGVHIDDEAVMVFGPLPRGHVRLRGVS